MQIEVYLSLNALALEMRLLTRLCGDFTAPSQNPPTWTVHKHLKVDHFVNPAQCTRYLITLFCGDSFIFVAGAWTLLWLLLWPHNCYLNSLRAFYGQLLPHKVDSDASRVTRVTCGRVSVLARVCQENWFVTRFCFLALRPVFSSQHFHH